MLILKTAVNKKKALCLPVTCLFSSPWTLFWSFIQKPKEKSLSEKFD